MNNEPREILRVSRNDEYEQYFTLSVRVLANTTFRHIANEYDLGKLSTNVAPDNVECYGT